MRRLALVLPLVVAGAAAGAELRVAALDRSDVTTGGAAADIPWDAVVRNAQRELATLGLYRGPLDGRFNAAFEEALRQFERKFGLDTDRRSMRGVVERMRSISAAMHLRKAFAETRRRQREQAISALRSNPQTRDLLARDDPVRSETPPLRPVKPGCERAVTVRCLLDEALHAVGNIESNTYRDWALRDIVTAHVRTGTFAGLRDTIRRISDPRLILVALRDVAKSMARHGDLDAAAALAATIPDLPNRAKAFAAIAVVRAEAGDTDGAAAFADRTLRTLERRPPVAGAVGIATGLANKFVDIGAPALARRAVDVAKRLDIPGPDPMVRAAEIGMLAAVEAEAGRYDAAIDILYLSRGESRPEDAASSASYRVSALSRLAETQHGRGDRAAAARSLVAAELSVAELRAGFPTDAGRARIAKAWMRLQAFDRASMAILEIANAAWRARLLWLLSDAYRAAGDGAAARLIEKEALAVTDAVTNGFDRTAIEGDNAVRLAGRGDATAARRIFALALANGRGITTPWWRARAFAHLASTLSGLERLGIRP